MRSPDLPTTIDLADFESSLRTEIKALNQDNEILSRQDLKASIRSYCKENAVKLGLSEGKALEISAYFFRFIYENPENIKKMWELLYKLSQNATNKLKANEIFNDLLKINPGGETLLWRLVRGIINGDFTIETIDVGTEAVYSIATPEDSIERRKDPSRQTISRILKEQIAEKIVQKPIPNTGEDALRMTVQDRALFFKIFTFLQSDTDAFVNSDAWQEGAGRYFEGISQYLVSMVKSLSVSEGKSNARQKRHRGFIKNVLKTYLKPLLEYCKIMIGNEHEQNPFVADLLFEHYLLSNNLINSDLKEPYYLIIDGKWQNLFGEIRRYIEDDATMYGIPVTAVGRISQSLDTLDEPESFGPQVTGEVPPKMIATVQEIARKEASSAVPMAFDETLPMNTFGNVDTETEQDDWDNIWGTKDNPVNTGKIQTLISEELKRFPNDTEGTENPINPANIRNGKILEPKYIAVIPNTEAEKFLIGKIRKNISKIFEKYRESIKSGTDKNFVSELCRVTKEQISTYNLMLEFILSLYIHNASLRISANKNESDNIFNNISTVFNKFGSNLHIPEEMLKKVGEKNDYTPVLNASDLQIIAEETPSIDSDDFKNLKAFLLSKKVYENFKHIEEIIKDTILTEDLEKLKLFRELNTRIRLAFSPQEGFIYYYEQKKAFIKDTLGTIKKLRGNWITKHLKFGRSKEVRKEMQVYLEELEKVINKTWDKALKPTLNQYGRIMFGSDLYIQKKW